MKVMGKRTAEVSATLGVWVIEHPSTRKDMGADWMAKIMNETPGLFSVEGCVTGRSGCLEAASHMHLELRRGG